MIEVRKINNVWLDIFSEHEGVYYELRDYFQFLVPNAQFMPAFKNGWDGKIRLFNPFERRLYVGLLPYLRLFAEQYGYDLLIDEDLKPRKIMTPEQVNEYCDSLEIYDEEGKKITPRFHQKMAFYHAVNNRRGVLVTPTAGGKSLMFYMFCNWALQHEMKSLIVVPTTGLVEQMSEDFCDYSQNKMKKHVHKIYSGKEKLSDKGIYVSTWQSIYEMPKSYFAQFDTVQIDECQGVQAKSLIELLEKSNADFRLGYTGTMHEPEAHKWVIEGLLGKTLDLISLKEMEENKWISEVKINCMVLEHPKKDWKKRTFQEEIEFIVNNEERNQKVCNLISSVKGNSFVLFDRVAHGKRLVEILKEQNPDRKVELVYGDTKTDVREEIRKSLADTEDAIVVASYKVFSAGISVRNLHHVFFASPIGKSNIRLFQSIGRALRVHAGKKIAQVWDIADKMYKKGDDPNYGIRHFKERVKMYIKKDLKYTIKKGNL